MRGAGRGAGSPSCAPASAAGRVLVVSAAASRIAARCWWCVLDGCIVRRRLQSRMWGLAAATAALLWPLAAV